MLNFLVHFIHLCSGQCPLEVPINNFVGLRSFASFGMSELIEQVHLLDPVVSEIPDDLVHVIFRQ